MSTQLQIERLHQALEAKDPQLADLIRSVSYGEEEPPETPIREGAMTFDKFFEQIRSPEFRRKTAEEQGHYRVEQLKALEADDAEVPLSARLRSHELILGLWELNNAYSRRCLLTVIAEVHLTYGPWRALKRIFKEAEARGDTEIYGALAARFDMALANGSHSVSHATLAYLCRRAWRYLRRTGESLPACYADVAGDFLARYTDNTYWAKTWIANHIFYHETREYNRRRFRFRSRPSTLLKYRAFAELWRRSPRPLFSLLERANSEQVRRFATGALKADFRTTLREIEPEWVARLTSVGSATIDDFVVWILGNVPRFEQSAFRELGLHEAVLRLFDSESTAARSYAVDYARTHARDLPVEELVRLANNDHKGVRKLAGDLLRSLDPRKEVGLEAWGQLLETRFGSDLAAEMLRKHFGAKELTPDWFEARLLSCSGHGFDFAVANLPQMHPTKKLGPTFFCDLIEKVDHSNYESYAPLRFVLEELEKFDLDSLDSGFLRRALVNDQTSYQIRRWIEEGRMKAETYGADFLKMLAFHPAWEKDEWIAELKKTIPWARDLAFDEELSEAILEWLKDVRRFSPDQLGFDWLMQLVNRSEPRYHDFAVDTMIRAFLPADFAPADEAAAESPAEADKGDEEIQVDLGGASFVFTGKLSTMTRAEAKNKVTKAGGANASTVNKKLDYLVIGDEGSALYGQGRKGSKQTKAESLNDADAGIRIISETAFLQMLAGEQREFSEDAVDAGCRRLWEMLTAPGKEDDPLSQFALKYMRRHHPDICLAETDRPCDPGAEIPPEFLTFEQVKPLFSDERKPLRDLALEWAKWEFAKWAPPIEGIIELCEVPHEEVRQFVAKAMTAEDLPEHKRYRLDPDILTADAVYSFCESHDEQTRSLGMHLIGKYPRLQLPEELFRLTESPDRNVRAFVIRTFWSWYRARGITADWKPGLPPQATTGAKAKKDAEEAAEKIGDGAPQRPENLPASLESLEDFLRRILFEIPPGRPEVVKGTAGEALVKLKPMPARKSKLFLVEVLRDLATEDAEFAERVLPLLSEFKGSRGQSEHAACLVAVTRILHVHPQLGAVEEQPS